MIAPLLFTVFLSPRYLPCRRAAMKMAIWTTVESITARLARWAAPRSTAAMSAYCRARMERAEREGLA